MSRVRWLLLGALAALAAFGVLLATAGAASPAPSSLDTTFGNAGSVLIPGGVGGALAVDASGDYVVAGTANQGSGFLVARLRPDGSRDPSFVPAGATPGSAVIPVPSGAASAVALLPNGDIAVAGSGTYAIPGNPTPGTEMVLVVLTPSGALEPSFNQGQPLGIPVGSGGDSAALAMAVSGSEIYLGGSALNGQPAKTEFALARVSAAGTVDGSSLTPVGDGGNAIARAMALTADGHIVLAGAASNANMQDVALARYAPSGTLDTGGFGVSGVALRSIPGGNADALAVTVQPSGDLVVGGNVSVASQGTTDALEIRFTAAGQPEGSFAQNGVYRRSLGTTAGIAGLAQDTAGHLIAAGAGTDTGTRHATATALTPDGQPAGDFNPSGAPAAEIGEYPVGSAASSATGVRTLASGAIVMAGPAVTSGGANAIGVVRLTGYVAGTSTSTSTTSGSASATSTTSSIVTSSTMSPAPYTTSIQAPVAPHAGVLLSINAASSPPGGQHTVLYEWALTNAAHFDASTSSSTLRQRFSPGPHTIWVRAISSGGLVSSESSVAFNVLPPPLTGCNGNNILGWIEITGAGCAIKLVDPSASSGKLVHALKNNGGGKGAQPLIAPAYYEVTVPAGGVGINGADVFCAASDPGCTIDLVAGRATNRSDGAPDGRHPFRIRSSGPVMMRLENAPSGPISLAPTVIDAVWNPPASGETSQPLLVAQVAPEQSLAHEAISGEVTVAMTPGAHKHPGLSLTVNLNLPFFGQNLAVPVTLSGDSTSGMETAPGGWEISLDGYMIPPIFYIDTGSVQYTPTQDGGFGFELQATVSFTLGGWTASGDVAFHVGSSGFVFDRASFSYDAGNGSTFENPHISPADTLTHLVGIDHLDAHLQINPYLDVGGTLIFDLGSYKIGGGGDYAAPHDGHGLHIGVTGAFPISVFDGQVTLVFDAPPTAAVGLSGTLSLDESPVFTVEGGVYAYFVFQPSFDMELGGHFTVTAFGINLASVKAFVNGEAVAGCGNILFASLWAAYQYSSSGPTGGFGGCDNIAPYSIAPQLAGLSSVQGHAAAAGWSVRAPKGQSWANLAVVSAAGLPQVTVTGPGGLDVTTPSSPSLTREGPAMSVGSATGHRLVLGIPHPSAGTYTIRPAPGSPAITQVFSSLSRATSASASVSGRGAIRRLRYAISGPAGEKVLLEERAGTTSRTIATVSNGRGTIRFRPFLSSMRRRTIVALPSVAGLPRGSLTLAHYRSAPLPVPARVRGLRLGYRRGLESVAATWRPLPGAVLYRVVVRARDGRRVRETIARRRLLLPAVAPRDRVVVTVRALSAMLIPGKATTARLTPRPVPVPPPVKVRRRR